MKGGHYQFPNQSDKSMMFSIFDIDILHRTQDLSYDIIIQNAQRRVCNAELNVNQWQSMQLNQL